MTNNTALRKAPSRKKKPLIFNDENPFKLSNLDVIAYLRTLPDNSIDVITTDPAYSGMNNMLKLGQGRIVGSYADKGKDSGKWFAEFEDSEENYRLFLSECKRVLKKDTGHIYIMFDSFSLLTLAPLLREYFDVKNLITWDKVNIGMGHYYRRRHEYVVFATNGNTHKISARNIPDVWRFKRIHRAPYPTQKPTEVFQVMLKASAAPGAIVCDPFLGSGSSGIAAMRMDCYFLGNDVSKESIALSRKRLKKYIKSGVDMCQVNSAAIEGEANFWD